MVPSNLTVRGFQALSLHRQATRQEELVQRKTTENRCCSRPTHLRGCIWSLVNNGDLDVDFGTGDDDYDDNDS